MNKGINIYDTECETKWETKWEKLANIKKQLEEIKKKKDEQIAQINQVINLMRKKIEQSQID